MGLEPTTSTLATSRSAGLNYIRVSTMLSVTLNSHEKLTTCIENVGSEDGNRTRNTEFGRLVLCQLSYLRRLQSE